MSDRPDSNKKLLLVAGGAVAAAGVAWFLLSKGQKEADEPVFTKKPAAAAAPSAAAAKTTTTSAAPAAPAASSTTTSAPKPQQQESAAAAPVASEPKPVAAAAAPEQQASLQRESTAALVNEYSFSGSDAAVAKPAEAEAEAGAVYQAPQADANGIIFFDTLGVRLQLQGEWKAAEETTPMPNIGMISFSKPEFSERQGNQMPGAVPVVLMSVEDISNEGIPVEEFCQHTKRMAMGQMQMMTNGMFQPQVMEEKKLDEPIGPFTHILMYELTTPYFGMQVVNLMAVVEGLAYIFQVMSNPNEFSSVRKEVVTMAKTCAIERRRAPADFRDRSCVTVTSLGGSAAMPPSWTVEKSSSANPLFKLQNASRERTEIVEVFNKTAADCVDLSGPQVKKEVEIRGVTVRDYGKTLRVAEKGDVIVQCTSKHSHGVITPAEVLVSIAESVDFSRQAPEDRLEYRSAALKLGFSMLPKAKIIESRVSERILVYAPMGIPTEPSSEVPMLTIRVGDPSNDPDCRTSFQEWMHRIKEETDGDSISGLKEDTIADRPCVTFVNKEMQEVGPGQKEERTAKVIIFLTGIRTTMLRWETPTGSWKKFEKKLGLVLDTLDLVE